jgi:hypothetical protein
MLSETNRNRVERDSLPKAAVGQRRGALANGARAEAGGATISDFLPGIYPPPRQKWDHGLRG